MRRDFAAACVGVALVLCAGLARAGGDEPANPHANNPHAGVPMTPSLPEDTAVDAPDVPTGTIVVKISDGDEKPLAGTTVTLRIIYNSVAKGESRKRVMATTDDHGVATFGGLDVGMGIAYRAMVISDGATFSAPPFQLQQKSGVRVALHVYPIEPDIEKTLVVTQAITYVEVKDDRVQIQEAFKVYNFGKNAWVPNDLVVPLPSEFTAFTSQQGMTDVGVDAVPKKGFKLRGTFPPGQHMIEFRWQLPYTGDADVRFDAGLPPHVAAARVIAPAARQMGLEVDGFPTPQSTQDGMGQRALVTEKQLRRDDPPLKLERVTIRGLPTEGSGKYVASLLAGCTVIVGLFFGTRKPPPRDTKAERKKLLADLESLERAHAAGDVGPKTYERARKEILDAIAKTFAVASTTGKKRAA